MSFVRHCEIGVVSVVEANHPGDIDTRSVRYLLVSTCRPKYIVIPKISCTYWWYMPVHDHDILVSFARKLICQRQTEDACANDDDPVACAHHCRVSM